MAEQPNVLLVLAAAGRWPGRIPAGRVLNGITSLEDIVPTLMAAVGVPDVKETSNGGRQGMMDDMLAGSSRR